MNIDVSLFHGNTFRKLAPKKVPRGIPDGTTGVVVSGAVYRLRQFPSGRYYVDLDDKAFDKDDCPIQRENEPLNVISAHLSLERLDWHLETNVYGHYLVFDGDQAVKNEVLSRLEEHGTGVRRCDRSFRPADNGRQYDWFVRLAVTGDTAEVKLPLEEILSSAGYPTAGKADITASLRHTHLSSDFTEDDDFDDEAASPAIDASVLAALVEALRSERDEWEQVATSVTDELERVEAERDHLVAEAREKEKAHRSEVEGYRTRIQVLETLIAGEVEEQNQAVRNIHAEKEALYEENVRLQRRISESESELEDLRTSVSNLTEAIKTHSIAETSGSKLTRSKVTGVRRPFGLAAAPAISRAGVLRSG